MPRNLIHFPPNVPVQLVIASDGRNAGGKVRYDLVDGRYMLVDLDVAQRITEHNINIGEPFWICLKWSGIANDPAHYDLWLDPAAERARAQEEAPEIERQLRESIRLAQEARCNGKPVQFRQPAAVEGKRPVSAPAPAVVSSSEVADSPLLDWTELLFVQTAALMDAYAKLLEYAGQNHGSMLLKPEDIRTMLVSVYISNTQRGRGKGMGYAA